MTNHEITLELIKLILRPNLLSSFDKVQSHHKPEEYTEFMAKVFNEIYSKLPPQEFSKNQSE